MGLQAFENKYVPCRKFCVLGSDIEAFLQEIKKEILRLEIHQEWAVGRLKNYVITENILRARSDYNKVIQIEAITGSMLGIAWMPC